jgi:hypothetical protein
MCCASSPPDAPTQRPDSTERDFQLRSAAPSLTTQHRSRWSAAFPADRILLKAICRPLCGLTFVALISGPAFGAPKSVVELFTSQGCSSCPAADKLIGEYAKRDDLLVLSFNVDYWDYLGWKDTLASPDNSDRQRAYAAARGDNDVYTPQVIVNGRDYVVGSDKAKIENALTTSAPLPIGIDLSEKEDAITVHIGEDKMVTHNRATLWLVFYKEEVSVPIERGENSGKTITYTNVVRKLRPIAMWKGEEMSVDLPKSEMAKAKTKRCAVLLQTENAAGLPGPVLGAAVLDEQRKSLETKPSN